MSRQEGDPAQRAGPLAYKRVFAELSRRTLHHSEFRRTRHRILDRFPWARTIDLAQERAIDDLLSKAMEDADIPLASALCRMVFGASLVQVADLNQEILELSERYGYDQIENGGYFMLQMVVTGKIPRLWEFGGYLRGEWKPWFFIDAEDTKEQFMQKVRVAAERAWRSVEQARIEEGRPNVERVPADVLYERVDWFFRKRVLGEQLTKIAFTANVSEKTIERGISQVTRLLGIPTRRGRPRKRH